mmetsp:Transcript_23743/g.39056  ORF Transcript_23743/g.39056 Transcript_23743/m.39056 type:complete len:204 (-) Transcript_23743:197-808(-)
MLWEMLKQRVYRLMNLVLTKAELEEGRVMSSMLLQGGDGNPCDDGNEVQAARGVGKGIRREKEPKALEDMELAARSWAIGAKGGTASKVNSGMLQLHLAVGMQSSNMQHTHSTGWLHQLLLKEQTVPQHCHWYHLRLVGPLLLPQMIFYLLTHFGLSSKSPFSPPLPICVPPTRSPQSDGSLFWILVLLRAAEACRALPDTCE